MALYYFALANSRPAPDQVGEDLPSDEAAAKRGLEIGADIGRHMLRSPLITVFNDKGERIA